MFKRFYLYESITFALLDLIFLKENLLKLGDFLNVLDENLPFSRYRSS